MDSAFRRRATALVAAYALALHGLLLAFGPAAAVAAGTSFAELCVHDGGGTTGDPSAPAGERCAALCAALGHGAAAPMPPGLGGVVMLAAELALPAPVDAQLVPHQRPGAPQLPRGPPLG
jgi:hypothetical protein